ncbi:MAG: hypothetical protein ACXAEX_14030 [Promethearchaeota archaeon]|jgi:hypothetical protein
MLDLVIVGLEIFMTIGFIGFWIYFFLVENKKSDQREGYLEFERSFPLADLGWVVPCLILGAIGLIMNQRYGIFFTITAGSALIFLGLLDISHNLQYKGYSGEKFDVLLNLIVNLLCVICGPIFLIFGWFNI